MKPAYLTGYFKRWNKGISPSEKQAVINFIIDNGALTEAEVSAGLYMDRNKVRRIMLDLREKGFIRTINKKEQPQKWTATL